MACGSVCGMDWTEPRTNHGPVSAVCHERKEDKAEEHKYFAGGEGGVGEVVYLGPDNVLYEGYKLRCQAGAHGLPGKTTISLKGGSLPGQQYLPVPNALPTPSSSASELPHVGLQQ